MHAGRRLITDDAGVVDERRLQIETWLYLDHKQLDHALTVGFGARDGIEISTSPVYGFTRSIPSVFGIRGPSAQAKLLLLEPVRWPGLALAAGLASPVGRGHLDPLGWAGYTYAASTWQVFDGVGALHVSGGATASDGADVAAVLGIATVAAVREPLSLFAELYRGDLSDARVEVLAIHGGAFWAVTESV